MPLALRLAANALLESIRGWMKASLAVRTAAGFGQCVSSEIERDSISELTRQRRVKRKDVETTVEYLPRPRPGCPHPGSGKPAILRVFYLGTDSLATKQGVDNSLVAAEKRIIKRIDESQEELARMVAEGFVDLQHRLDVQQLIQIHERKFKKLEEALHITL
jgi:hypothetical protein